MPFLVTQHDEWWDFSGWIDQGYCTTLQSPSWITLPQGKSTKFSILAYDFKCGRMHCNQTGEYCANCKMCRFYSGTPLVFQVTIMDLDGNPAPSTSCTISNYDSSLYGVYPVSCIAKNTLAGTLQPFYVELGFNSSYIPDDAKLQQPVPSEILVTTIGMHPNVFFVAGWLHRLPSVIAIYACWKCQTFLGCCTYKIHRFRK